ncbi:hypothetical protein ALO93_200303 [Pseudomonas amygdali pv. sesami]|nr:hypothetical protein ALO93_200303 [Pseudomonas amygdali pv. sesami]
MESRGTHNVYYVKLYLFVTATSNLSNPTYLRSNPHKPPFPRNSKVWVPFIILSLRMALH